MPSPFPGMDPYIESQGRWRDLHASMITYFRDLLGGHLPDDYVAQIDEEVHLVRWKPGELRRVVPDVSVARKGRPITPEPVRSGGAALAVLEPDVEPISVTLVEREQQVRDTWIEILHLPELKLVTVIELLSPTNKASSGREQYLDKRVRLLGQGVHLVEIDLLLGGARLPMGEELPPGDCFAFVSRSERRPLSDVYAWSIRRRLPKIPIPLLAPDPDIPLDLAAVFATAYERGRYARLIDYQAPLTGPISPEDRAWAESLARAGRPAS